jgi:hypothetical protein
MAVMGEFFCDPLGEVSGGLVEGLGVVVDVIDESDLEGTLGVDVLTGEGELAGVSLSDDGGQPLEASQVCDDGELDLSEGELCLGGADADVAGRGEVQSAADAPAIDRGDDRLPAGCRGAGGALHLVDEAQQLGALPREHGAHHLVAQDGHHGHQVEAVAEVVAAAADDDGADAVIVVQGTECRRELVPGGRPHRVSATGPGQDNLGNCAILVELKRVERTRHGSLSVSV